MARLTEDQEGYLFRALVARMEDILGDDGNLTLKRSENANGLNYYYLQNQHGIDVIRVEDEIADRLTRQGAILRLKELWKTQCTPRHNVSIQDYMLASLIRLGEMNDISKEYNINIDLYLEWPNA